MICATMAPSLPHAAENPCPVARYRVGKTSPGITKVVTFGPKFWKKFARQKRNIRSFSLQIDWVNSSNPKPGVGLINLHKGISDETYP